MNNVSYFARFNISSYRSKVTDLQGRGPLISEAQYTNEGLPIRNYYGYVTDGYFNPPQEIDQYDVAQSAVATAYVGGLRYADLNNNGQVTTAARVASDEHGRATGGEE